MTATHEGGLKTAETNKRKYGENYYRNIGRKGGSVSHRSTRYFAMHPEVARTAGAKGGSRSRRGPAKKKPIIEDAPIIPKERLTASSKFVEHVDTKKKFRWPWSK